jgi:hypothetical protein
MKIADNSLRDASEQTPRREQCPAVSSDASVSHESAAAFESIESAQEYFELLAEVILESQQTVQADIQVKADSGSARHVEALRLIGFKLERLASHIKTSRRILNDLRMLRRIVYQRDGDGGGGLND